MKSSARPIRYSKNKWIAHSQICRTAITAAESSYVEDGTSEHEGLELVLPVSGIHTIKARKKEVLFGPKSFYLHNGREPHTAGMIGDSYMNGIALIISPTFIDKLVEGSGIYADELLLNEGVFSEDADIRKILQNLYCFRVNDPEAKNVDVGFDAAVTDLTIHILTRYPHSYSAMIDRYSRSGHFPDAFARAKRFMYQYRCEPGLSLELIAEKAGLSKFHFSREFRQHSSGVTPMEYLNRLRVEEAQALLRRERKSIAEIAFEVGCHDLSTFNRLVKRTTGFTPSQIRKTAINA